MNRKHVLFSPLSPAHRDDPYAVYQALVDDAPIHQTRSGLVLVTGNRLAMNVLKDRNFRTDYQKAFESTYGPGYLEHASLRVLSECFVLTANKADGKIRRLFTRVLSPQRVADEAGALQRMARELMSPLATHAKVDIYREFAVPFAMRALESILGIPPEICNRIPEVSPGLFTALDCAKLGAAQLRELDVGTEAAAASIARYLESPQARQSGPISELLDIAGEYGLSHRNIAADIVFVLLAGFETSSTTISQIAAHLSEHPEIAHTLHQFPEKVPQAVEEYLRLFPSVHIVTRRPAAATVIDNCPVDTSTTVLVLLASANRDREMFSNPGDFVLERENRSALLTFSAGVHFCVGAVHARQQFRACIDMWTSEFRLPKRAHTAQWRRLGVFRSLQALWLQDPLPT
jgi:cytochrome P450